MIAANPSRSSDVPAGPRSSNIVAASAAPNWIDVTPHSTRPIGGTRSSPGSPCAVAVCTSQHGSDDRAAPVLGGHDAVAAVALGAVQRGVGARDELVGGLVA